MNGYTQLTREQRYQIYALQKQGHNRTQIALKVGVQQATIWRELRRNLGGRVAGPTPAAELAPEREAAITSEYGRDSRPLSRG